MLAVSGFGYRSCMVFTILIRTGLCWLIDNITVASIGLVCSTFSTSLPQYKPEIVEMFNLMGRVVVYPTRDESFNIYSNSSATKLPDAGANWWSQFLIGEVISSYYYPFVLSCMDIHIP